MKRSNQIVRIIIQFRYITGLRETIGISAVLSRDNTWKCYMGTCPGEDEKFDSRYVADLGNKVPEKIARATFPMIKKPYKI